MKLLQMVLQLLVTRRNDLQHLGGARSGRSSDGCTLGAFELLARLLCCGRVTLIAIICALFLELNGISVIASQEEVVEIMLGVADGSVTEESFLAWLEQSSVTTDLN